MSKIHPHASHPVDRPAYHARRIRTVLHWTNTKAHVSSLLGLSLTSSTSITPAIDHDIRRLLVNLCVWDLTIQQSLEWNNYDPGQSKAEIRCDAPVKTSHIHSKKWSHRQIWPTSPEYGCDENERLSLGWTRTDGQK